MGEDYKVIKNKAYLSTAIKEILTNSRDYILSYKRMGKLEYRRNVPRYPKLKIFKMRTHKTQNMKIKKHNEIKQ